MNVPRPIYGTYLGRVQFMPRLLLPISLLSAFLVGCGVSSVQAAPTPFQSAPLFSPSDLSVRTLPNGVRAIVKRAPGTPTLSIQVWVRAGSRYETDKESGVAHLVETCCLRASKNQPTRSLGEGGLAGALRKVGGDAGALTSRDATFYSATVATQFAPEAMSALADTLLRPDLSEDAVDESKLEVSDDLARRALDSVASASDLAYATAYSKHPYRRSAWGDDETVAALPAAKVRDYYKRLYVGANTSVVIVGDISFESAHNLIRQNFGTLPVGKEAVRTLPPDGPLKDREAFRRATLVRDAVALAWRSSPIANPHDVVAMDTLLALWREGIDPSLRQKLIRGGPESTDNPPLASAYEVDFLTQRDAGLFLITLAGTSDKEAAIKAVTDEVERARKGSLSTAEVNHAKQLLRAQYIEQAENPAGQAGSLGFYDIISSYQFAVNYLSLCATVTPADLKRVAQKYFAPSALVRVELDPVKAPRERPEVPRPGDPDIVPASFKGHHS
ncbi:putative zinc protease [Abditibacteriota bacterium]|nr:putative zinc protease [Abditibacteriota bacterium]